MRKIRNLPRRSHFSCLRKSGCIGFCVRAFIVSFFFIAATCGASQALAVAISASIPGMAGSPTTASPQSFVAGFYKFALMIGGVLALGAVVYGGVLYATSAGNPSKQSEGREWIQSALFGILLLAGAYLILYTVNPDIVSLNLPTLTAVNIAAPGAAGGGGASGGGTANSGTASSLKGVGINIKSGASVDGLHPGIVNGLENLAQGCGSKCNVTVTAGTDGAHRPGEYSHANGYKADIRLDSATSNYIMNNFQPVGNRTSDNAALYLDPNTNTLYAREPTHWDVVNRG
jgi:Type IV secretion system pilin